MTKINPGGQRKRVSVRQNNRETNQRIEHALKEGSKAYEEECRRNKERHEELKSSLTTESPKSEKEREAQGSERTAQTKEREAATKEREAAAYREDHQKSVKKILKGQDESHDLLELIAKNTMPDSPRAEERASQEKARADANSAEKKKVEAQLADAKSKLYHQQQKSRKEMMELKQKNKVVKGKLDAETAEKKRLQAENERLKAQLEDKMRSKTASDSDNSANSSDLKAHQGLSKSDINIDSSSNPAHDKSSFVKKAQAGYDDIKSRNAKGRNNRRMTRSALD